MAKAKATTEVLEAHTKKGPIEVQVNRIGTEKSLTVTLNGSKEPKYSFLGEWTGKDVSVLIRTLRRAYIMSNVELRRANAKPAVTLQEVSNA